MLLDRGEEEAVDDKQSSPEGIVTPFFYVAIDTFLPLLTSSRRRRDAFPDKDEVQS